MLSLPEDWDYTMEGLARICIQPFLVTYKLF